MTLASGWKRNPALLLAIVIPLFLAIAVVGSAYGNEPIVKQMPNGCPPSC